MILWVCEMKNIQIINWIQNNFQSLKILFGISFCYRTTQSNCLTRWSPINEKRNTLKRKDRKWIHPRTGNSVTNYSRNLLKKWLEIGDLRCFHIDCMIIDKWFDHSVQTLFGYTQQSKTKKVIFDQQLLSETPKHE